MEYKYNKTKDKLIEAIENEIKSHKKYEVINEIKGEIKGNKVELYVENNSTIVNTYFKNYFIGKLIEAEGKTKLKGRYSMRFYKIVLLIIMLLLCVEVIVFNVIVQNPIMNIVPAIIIILAESGLLIFEKAVSRKEKVIIERFLNSL